MGNLFIISNAYNIEIILYNISVINQTKHILENVILLEENYLDKDKCFGIHVNYMRNLDECIINSSYVLIVETPFFPASTVIYTEKICRSHNIPYYIISEDKLDYCSNTDDVSNTAISCITQPIILNISIGNATRLSNTEVIVSEVLKELGANYKQNFTPLTYYLYMSFENLGLIQSVTVNNPEFDVLVDFWECEDLNVLHQRIKNIIDISPDIIIINIPADYKDKDIDYINNLILYVLGKKVDMIIMSSHFIINDYLCSTNKCYEINANDVSCNNLFSINNKELKDVVRNTILRKIVFPDTVEKLF